MQIPNSRTAGTQCAICVLALMTAASTSAQVNSWINPGSGEWDQPSNWSLGVRPDSSQSVFITNSVWKAVAINASTPVNFPGTMTVDNLTIRGASNTLNTLLLNFFGTAVPLRVVHELTVADHAQILNFNSGLVVDGGLVVTNAQLVQDGGYIGTSAATLRNAVFEMTNGLFEAGQVILGLPVSATVNQYGGRAVISDLQFGRGPTSGAGGNYRLYGGELNLPNGITMLGDNNAVSSYFQAGGTNRTPSIFMEAGLFGISPTFALNGGVLAVGEVELLGDRYGGVGIVQNGGTHIITNTLNLIGGAQNPDNIKRASYHLFNGALSARIIELAGSEGDAVFVQSNGTTQAGTIYAHSTGYFSSFNTYITLAGGTLSCSNLITVDGGDRFTQTDGALVVSNLLDFGGSREVGIGNRIYGHYTFTGGTVTASNINITGTWTIGDSFVSRISNPGFFKLSHTLQVSNVVEKLGRFILASNSIIDLSGEAGKLTFADSSAEVWNESAKLIVTNWNSLTPERYAGDELRFGSNQFGLTPAQLGQIHFINPAGYSPGDYAAGIGTDGLVYPSGTASGDLTNDWVGANGYWHDLTWSLGVRPDSSQTVRIIGGNRTVTAHATTAANYPASLTVHDLIVRGLSGTPNLVLSNAGTATPLRALNGLAVEDGAKLLNLNSGLIVDGTLFNVTNSQIIQDGGFVRVTNAWMRLLNSTYHMTNGVFEGGTVWAGTPYPSLPGQFNQYGGAVKITNLGLYNNYSLYGGTLDLPGGMNLIGQQGGTSYFQAGGTNRTSHVLMEDDYSGSGPHLTLNGGLLAAGDVDVRSGWFGVTTFVQNGGTHIVTNSLKVVGGSTTGATVKPATYYLNAGTLSARDMELNGNQGDAVFVQTNGTAQVETIYGHSVGYYGSFVVNMVMSGGSLSCSNFTLDDGRGNFTQSGGAFVVSNLLTITGYRDLNIKCYGSYTFNGGTVTASNINMAGNWFIGDGSPNRVSNPGFFRLSHLLQIGNATEQLGRFILVSNATINLAGSASRLTFVNSSGEAWAGGAILTVANWNGNPSGGGAEQLKFGTSPSGLTSAQLSQIQFLIGTNIYAAKILNTGEVVPDQTSPPGGLVNSWITGSGNWDVPSNWSLGIRPDSSQAVMITNSGWKAVAINASTPINFPASMTVSNLTLRGAWDTYNTLLLNFAGTAVPLTVLNGLTIADNAQILNFNSGLDVQGGTITVTNAQLVQDGGYFGAMKATMNLQNAVYQMTNGLFEGGSVLLGFPVSARFNQYGGLVMITNLVFGQGNSAAGGHYALYGGDLRLPNGLRLLGGNNAVSSYLQNGGTNRTTSVFLEPNLFGISPSFTLNGGLLADNDVTLLADNFGSITLQHNAGTHIVSNLLSIAGGASAGASPKPATYQLYGGTLFASNIVLNGSQGDAVFSQTNGLTQAGQIQASSGGPFTFFTTRMALSGGTLNAGSLSMNDGGNLLQSGGMMVVSNTLSLNGYRQPGPRIYTRYDFFGGTLIASNINVGGDWNIGDSGGTNRISNPGTVSLSQLLQIGNAVEQLGRFILATNATINLAGNASRLSFANSSGQTWIGDATLVVSNWNGNLSGGGTEQLRFGTNQSGLTSAQLNQIWFRIDSDLYTARILNTGEVVPSVPVRTSLAFSRQGNNLMLSWPGGWVLQSSTNVFGSYTDVQVTSPYTVNTTLEPQRFFRLHLTQ